MNRTWLKVLCAFWLIAVTPLFGLIPLWCIVTGDGSSTLCRLELAFLLSVWVLFFPHPQPGFEDVSPPLTEIQWWTMISIVLGGAIAALYYCFKSGSRQSVK
jgi:hypothetical protein